MRLTKGKNQVQLEAYGREVSLHIENTMCAELLRATVREPLQPGGLPLPRFSLKFHDVSGRQIKDPEPVVIKIKMGTPVDGKLVSLCAAGKSVEACVSAKGILRVKAPACDLSSLTFSVDIFQSIDSDSLISSLEVPRGPRQYDRFYSDWDETTQQFERGGLPYFLPYGFQRIAIQVDMTGFEDAVVAYHGTSLDSARRILLEGFEIQNNVCPVSSSGVPTNPKHQTLSP